jgi:hypothetical protein
MWNWPFYKFLHYTSKRRKVDFIHERNDAGLSVAQRAGEERTGRHRSFLFGKASSPFLESQPSTVSMTGISVETKYFPSSGASSPALALQVTCLVDSYMLWIGVTEELEENASNATLQGHLGKDWAVSMPPWKVRNLRKEGIGRLRREISFLHCISRHCQQREVSCCGRRARIWPFR